MKYIYKRWGPKGVTKGGLNTPGTISVVVQRRCNHHNLFPGLLVSCTGG